MVRTMLRISHFLYFAEGYSGLLAFQRIPPEREKGTLYALVQQGGVRTHLQITNWGIADLLLIRGEKTSLVAWANHRKVASGYR